MKKLSNSMKLLIILYKNLKKSILIVQGDFNANIGSDANVEWAECSGRFGIGVRNERGQILLEFSE